LRPTRRSWNKERIRRKAGFNVRLARQNEALARATLAACVMSAVLIFGSDNLWVTTGGAREDKMATFVESWRGGTHVHDNYLVELPNAAIRSAFPPITMTKIASAFLVLGFWFFLRGCQSLHARPTDVPFSAVWADGTFIDCKTSELRSYRCTAYNDRSGAILADGLFVSSDSSEKFGVTQLQYAGYRVNYPEREILLRDGRILRLREAFERDPTNSLIDDRLKAISSGSGQTVDCGETTTNRPDPQVAECAKTAFRNRRPFHARYRDAGGVSHFSYGLASAGDGNLFQVVYDMRGLLNLSLPTKAQIFDENRLGLIACPSPITLSEGGGGLPGCSPPIDERASEIAAKQKPIDATVCAVLQKPYAFNNKLVRIRGHVSGNFEYSLLDGDGCSGSIWFEYGNDGAPPGLVAHVSGDAMPGVEDEGKWIRAVPVKLRRDSNFNRFQLLMIARVKVDALSEKLNPDKATFHHVTATFIGRIDGVSPAIHEFHLKRSPLDRADFLGFGQMGLFDAQLVVQSVENDAALDGNPPMPASQ
jgi:hypothetical protein